MSNKLFTAIIALLLTMHFGCGSDSATQGGSAGASSKENKATLHALSDPEMMTPFNANDNGATLIQANTHQNLLSIDFKTNKIAPILVTARPDFKKADNGTISAEMEIRKEAKWDDGTPITGNDVAFSLKVLLNPETNCKHDKPYFEKISDLIVDKANPKKFKLVLAEPYHLAETSLTGLMVIPKKVYDPEGIMDGFTINQLHKDAKGSKKLTKDANIKKFAEFYNGPKFQREVVAGSGAYKFKEWQTNQRVKLELKEDWWGHALSNESHHFEAYAKELVYETVNDLSTAVVALKGQKLDAMYGIPPKDFQTDLRKSANFTNQFNTYTPPLFSYDYMAFNTRLGKFNDVKVRRALSHAMNVEQLIKTFCYGLGVQVASFVHPDIKDRLNPNVKPYEYDLNKARKLLAEAGWKDSNGNGIVDKMIEGELEEFEIKLNFNNGNSRRERACLIFQEAAKKIGVRVSIIPLEWAVLLEKTKAQDFEMFVMGWISSPLESDPKQIWHTDSSKDGGSNYTNFGTPESDKLIEDLRYEMDPAVRVKHYQKLQQVIHDEAPYIFLLAQKERIAVNKRFGNAYGSGIKPGYWAPGFKLSAPNPN